jgi:ATP-dependent protease ClpP protease subunit
MRYDPLRDQIADQRKKACAARNRWKALPETWLSLTGDVDAAAVQHIIDRLDRAPDDAPVILQIASPGGNPEEAFRLYARLRDHPGPVTTSTDSRADSAALLVFMAGDQRTAAAGATFLVHGCSRPPTNRPTASVLRGDAAELEAIDRDIANLVCIRADRYPLWQLRADMDREATLSAADAQLRGLVTTVT